MYTFEWKPDNQKQCVVVTLTIDMSKFNAAVEQAAKNIILLGEDDDGTISIKSTGRDAPKPSLERPQGADPTGG